MTKTLTSPRNKRRNLSQGADLMESSLATRNDRVLSSSHETSC